MPESQSEIPSHIPQNSFALMPELQRRFPRPGSRWLWVWKLRYGLLARWRRFRIHRWITRLLGPQYRRSRDMIEIDITYLCNLHCLNCNRSVTQAREVRHMSLQMITNFVDESVASGKLWRRIRVLGGEPTLHPQFPKIIEELLRYTQTSPTTLIEVVTNGYGRKVERVLSALPPNVLVDNSQKKSAIQPYFGPFNLAPIDDKAFSSADYSNGCDVLRDCGMGLTPDGYYPCAVAGGIDRILGEQLGLNNLPDDADDMLAQVERLCQLCGRFRDGHFIPRPLKAELDGAPVSASWKKLYASWADRQIASKEEKP